MNKQALIEALKEICRWTILFVISWVITETLKQMNLVPEFANIRVWVFTYLIPIRSVLQFGLTFIGRAVDKYMFEDSKQDFNKVTQGLLPF